MVPVGKSDLLNQCRILVTRPRAVHAFRHLPFLQHVFARRPHQRRCFFHVATFALLESFASRITGIRSCTSATNLLGSVITIVHDLTGSPVAASTHASWMAAIVITAPSRRVK